MFGFAARLTLLEEALELLPDKPEETPDSTLKALWMTAAGSPMSAERASAARLPYLDADQNAYLDEMIERRLSGVPLGHLTQRQMFFEIELIVNADALLPRRETEILASAAAEIVAELIDVQGSALMVDTCCGSGNVALAVAHRAPKLRVIGVDLSSEAIDLARANSRNLGLDDRVEFRTGDMLAPVQDVVGETDLITCNPPYISSTKVAEMAEEIALYEPQMAFDGGPFGVRILHRLIKEAPAVLRPGGHLAFEVGLGQGEPMISRMKKLGIFALGEPLRDDSGAIRAVVGRLM